MAAPQTQIITEKNETLKTASELGFTHPDGKRFSYWTKNREGNGDRFYDGDVAAIDSSITLYAQWGKGCVVNWDSQGGTKVQSQMVDTGSAIGSLPTPTRSEYNLNGWWTEATGGTQIRTTTTVNSDVTYYAHWTGKTYTMEPSSRYFEDGYPSHEDKIFSKISKGTFRLVIDKLNIIHSGGKAYHCIYLNLRVENNANTSNYTYLPMSSSNTTLADSPSGVHFDTRGFYIGGKLQTFSQLYVQGHKDGAGTGYFKCTVNVNLPYAKNNIYIFVDPQDRGNCSGALRYSSNATITLTKI